MHFSHKIQPSELFSFFADQPWAMWLDSCQSDHIDSRYDIIVWQPHCKLISKEGTTIIESIDANGNVTSISDNKTQPLSLLQLTQKEFFKQYKIKKHSIPFLTGALGYLSYDLGRTIESLPSQAEKDIELPEMAMGIYTQAVVYDNKIEQYFLVCIDDVRPLLEQELQLKAKQFTQQHAISFELTKSWQANMMKSNYTEKFDRIQQYLLSGDCYQINLTQRFSSEYSGDEFGAYLALREQNQAPFSAFIRIPEYAIMSISPERFVQVSGRKIQSKPIKGTKARSSDERKDQLNAELLKSSVKDKAENLMIVDLLRNDISKVSTPGSVLVPSLFDIESFPSVHHLVSTVEGELDQGFDACDLLNAAFPGGSITGAPKIRAMEIIDELEPQRRSIYCGSIAYISACGNMDSSITIRTLLCHNDQIHCWAGGGIVADSNVGEEYQESLDKVNKILPVLEKL